MTDKEKVQAQIDQNEKDQQKLKEEQGRLEKELKSLDKPKLNHLDYAIHDDGKLRVFVEKPNGVFWAYTASGHCCNYNVKARDFGRSGFYGKVLGNIKSLLGVIK